MKRGWLKEPVGSIVGGAFIIGLLALTLNGFLGVVGVEIGLSKMGWIAGGLVLFIVGGGVLDRVGKRRRARDEAWRAAAEALALDFDVRADVGERGALCVVRGRRDGLRLRAAIETHGFGELRSYTVCEASARVPIRLGAVVVKRTGQEAVRTAAGKRDLKVGEREFDRAFDVRVDDDARQHELAALLSADVRASLSRLAPLVSELRLDDGGLRVVVYWQLRETGELVELLSTCREVVELLRAAHQSVDIAELVEATVRSPR